MGSKKRTLGFLKYVIALLVLFLLGNSLVVCRENEYKLIRQFGRVQRVVSTSGLSFKLPFIQTTDTVPKEILLYDLPASDVITSDKKSMIVDSYVLWRVTDPLTFTQTLAALHSMCRPPSVCRAATVVGATGRVLVTVVQLSAISTSVL